MGAQYRLTWKRERSPSGMLETGWLRRERSEFLSLLRALTEEHWTRPTECPAWTVKQVALHVLGDDLSLLSRQRDAAPQGPAAVCREAPRERLPSAAGRLSTGGWVTASTFLSTDLLITLLDLTGGIVYESLEVVGFGSTVR